MGIAQGAARVFRLDEAGWLRHANPWSVWTRNTCLPLLALAIWSRVWIGWWAWLPVVLAVLWAWLNPRAFPPPQSLDKWASKAVMGERVWLNRGVVPIPSGHARAAVVLSIVSASGLPFLAWGLWRLEVWPTCLGMVLVMLGKLWFLDRMVWLYEDVKDACPEYRAWSQGGDDGSTMSRGIVL